MSKWTVLLGIIVASVVLYKVHVQEVTFVDVFHYVAVNDTDSVKTDLPKLLFSKNNAIKSRPARPVRKKPAVKQKDQSLKIMAFGDVMLGRYVRILMEENGLDYPFREIQNPADWFIEGANVVFANLEGPIDGEGKKGGTEMVFSFNRDIAPVLKNYGFTLLSIANNHGFDQGQRGREDTIKTLDENGLGWCGNSNDVDADSVYYGSIEDKKYAFICFHSAIRKLDLDAATELIKSVRPNVDYLVVSIHWGIEYQHTANEELQVKPGRAFVDAGADFVIGHHPHVVENFEVYNGKLIFYSLGNFVFDQYWSGDTQEGLAIGIVMNRSTPDESLHTKVYLFPMKSEKSQSRMMTEYERARWLPKFIGYGSYDETMQQEIRDGVIEIP